MPLNLDLNKKYKLLPNQVIVKEETFGVEWVYDLEDEDYEFVKTRGKVDEAGNIVLSYPLVASLKRWTSSIALKKIEEEYQELKIPGIKIAYKISDSEIELPQLHNCTNSQLEEYLSLFGGYRAYLEAMLAKLESDKGVLEAAFEEGLAKMFYTVSQGYEKKPTKEILRGQSIASSPQLRETRIKMIEVDGLLSRVRGMKEAYKAAYDATSRIVSLRTSTREQV